MMEHLVTEKVDMLKQFLAENGIKVHRDMQGVVDLIDGKPLEARTIHFPSNQAVLDWLIMEGYENFSYYTFINIGGGCIRFAAW